METKNQYLHEVAITAIIVKDGKYLIVRRAPSKKKISRDVDGAGWPDGNQ